MNSLGCVSDSDRMVQYMAKLLPALLLRGNSKRKRNTEQGKTSNSGRKVDKQYSGEIQRSSSFSDTCFETKEGERRNKTRNSAEFDLNDVATIGNFTPNNTRQRKVNGINKQIDKNEELLNTCQAIQKGMNEERLIKKMKRSSDSVADTNDFKGGGKNKMMRYDNFKNEDEQVLIEEIEDVQEDEDQYFATEYFEVDSKKFVESNYNEEKTKGDNIVYCVDDSDEDDDCILIGTKSITKSSSVCKSAVATNRNIATKHNAKNGSPCSLNKKTKSVDAGVVNNKNISSIKNNDYNNSNNNNNNNSTHSDATESNTDNIVGPAGETDFAEISSKKLLESLSSNAKIYNFLNEFLSLNLKKPSESVETPKKLSSSVSFTSDTCTPTYSLSFSADSDSCSPQASSQNSSKIMNSSTLLSSLQSSVGISETEFETVVKSLMSSVKNSFSPTAPPYITSVSGSRSEGCSSVDVSQCIDTSFCVTSPAAIKSLHLLNVGNSTTNETSQAHTFSTDNLTALSSLSMFTDSNYAVTGAAETFNLSNRCTDNSTVSDKSINTFSSGPCTSLNSSSVLSADKPSMCDSQAVISEDNELIKDDEESSLQSYAQSNLSCDNVHCGSGSFFPVSSFCTTSSSNNLITPDCFTDLSAFKGFLKRVRNSYAENKILCNTDSINEGKNSEKFILSTTALYNVFQNSFSIVSPSTIGYLNKKLYSDLSVPWLIYILSGIRLPVLSLFNSHVTKNASPGFNEVMCLLGLIAKVGLCDLSSAWTKAEISKFKNFIRRLQT